MTYFVINMVLNEWYTAVQLVDWWCLCTAVAGDQHGGVLPALHEDVPGQPAGARHLSHEPESQRHTEVQELRQVNEAIPFL